MSLHKLHGYDLELRTWERSIAIEFQELLKMQQVTSFPDEFCQRRRKVRFHIFVDSFPVADADSYWTI